MKLGTVICILSLLQGLVFQSEAESSGDRLCTPSFLEVSEDGPITAEVGIWEVVFNVALVGCAERLQQLTRQELSSLETEFLEPSGWSNLTLVAESAEAGFRRKAVERVEEILGRRVVTDILFHDITVIDHNVQ